MATKQPVTVDAAAIDAAIVAFFEASGRLTDVGFDGPFTEALSEAGSMRLLSAYLAVDQDAEELEPIFERLNIEAERRQLLPI